MNTYVIRREKAWASPEELEATAARSKEVAETSFPDDIRWIRSYVIAEPGGTLGTVCIYQASSEEAVREHAGRVDMPADEILEVADTVIIRPDPAPEGASA
jgi:sporulation protein YlmC with PRC-barrel domain